MSEYGLYCKPRTYFSYDTNRCEPVPGCTDKVRDTFIAREYTATSDTVCLPCPVCPLGYCCDADDCNCTTYRDQSLPPKWVQQQICILWQH